MNRLVLSGLAAVLLGGCAHAASTKAPFKTPLKWTASDIVVGPVPDGSHPVVAVKDPSIVRYKGKWHIYATTASTNGAWGMEYISFRDWKDAAKAKPYFLDDNPNLRGYHCAPQVFYFTPQKKWYLIYQSQQPQYSTTDDLSKPETWSRPENFFDNMPASGLRLDYWVICDDTYAYLFATGDDGNVYRSRTKIGDFPKGMSDFEKVISGLRNDVFEGGMTYKIKGTNKYLTLVEAIGPARYYRAWIADRLDGEWTELDGANIWETPFVGMNNSIPARSGCCRCWLKRRRPGRLSRNRMCATGRACFCRATEKTVCAYSWPTGRTARERWCPILQNPPAGPIDQAAILVDNLVKGVLIFLNNKAL